MRRIVVGLLIVCLACFTIGCSGGDSSPKQPGEYAPPPGGASSGGSTAKEQKEAAKDKVGAAADPAS